MRVFPDPNFRAVTLATDPGWQFDVKLDHQITDKHKISGRYSQHHDIYTTPTIVGNGDFNDGVIFTTDVHNASLEYNWSVSPTAALDEPLQRRSGQGSWKIEQLSDLERCRPAFSFGGEWT